MAKPPAPPKVTPPTFEAAITRLEEIVEEMDEKNVPLHELVTRYEEGMQLAKVCEKQLQEAEARIELLSRDAAGKPELVEFEAEQPTPPATREDVSLF